MQAHNVHSLFESNSAIINYGIIKVHDKSHFVIESEGSVITAKQAMSCLLKPEVGDKVMFSLTTADRNYILAVLERESACRANVEFEGDINLSSREGRVSISSSEGVDLITAGKLELLSSDLAISSVTAEITTDTLSTTASHIKATTQQVHLIADSINTVAERMTQRLKYCFRWVDGLEQVKAGQMIHSIRQLFSVRSRQAMVTAKQDVKIDGERIHMG